MLNTDRIILSLQWFVLLALFSYDGFTYLSEESNVGMYKIIYYAIIFCCFVMIVLLQTHRSKIPIQRIGTISYLIQAYIWIYLIRLCYDLIVLNVEQTIVVNPIAGVFLYANAAIIPFYFLQFFRFELIDFRKLNTALLLIFLTMGLVSISYILTGKATDYIGSDGRFMGNAAMDTIAFGHLGTSITILAIAQLYQLGTKWWYKLLSIGAILVGLFITIAAGSRGAIVALIVCIIAYFYIQGHKKKILIGIPLLAVFLFALLPFLNDFLTALDNQAMDRLYASIYDPDSLDSGVTSGRDVLYEKAWQNFSESPFLGSSFFIDGMYVHNSIFESFIGLGVFGGVLFICILGFILKKAIQLAERNRRFMFLSLLCIQYISYSLLSRTLSVLPLFWLTLFLVIIAHAHETEYTD